MKVSVVIPAFNEEKYIGKCLESIIAQVEKPDEIIVVDNNCTDKTVAIVRNRGAKIIKEKDQGMIHARNAGFDAANYEIIARTDADTILPRDWILKIKGYFKDPNLGALSGPVAYFSLPILSEIFRFGAFLTFKIMGLFFGHEMLAGPNMVLRKSLWEKVKDSLCIKDSDVHEDIDLSIHFAKIARIKYDWNFGISTARARWMKIFTEYIVRLTRMFLSHKLPLRGGKSRSGRK